MTGIQEPLKSLEYARNVRVLIGQSQDKMKQIKNQYPQRNRFEMAAHELEMKFKKRQSRPTHPHSIETYTNPFKRKII